MKSKETLRKTILIKRKFTDPETLLDKSFAITERAKQIPCLQETPCLLVYLGKPEEASTQALIAWAFKKRKQVLVPITGANGQLDWSELNEDDTLKKGPLGIPIPETLRPSTPPTDAPVIVPIVAFSENGHRIGHGVGYYDRFLASHKGFKIAIAFESQLVPPFKHESHDIPMDAILTESTQYILNDDVSDN